MQSQANDVAHSKTTSGRTGAPDDGLFIGGTVSGLQGLGLTLQLNGGQELSIAANGTFAFPNALPSGSTYVVTVEDQPSAQREVCAVDNASGTLVQTSVTDVGISCSIVAGFLYSTAGGSNDLVSYGISPGADALLPTGWSMPLSSGEWDIVAAPGRKFLYVSNAEFGANSISAYAVNSDTGALTPIGAAHRSRATGARWLRSRQADTSTRSTI
jgi:hypothetical protein